MLIFIYLEGDNKIIDNVAQELGLKKMPLSSLPNFFQLSYSLKLELEEKKDYNLEGYLLTHFPDEILEKIIYDEKNVEVISTDKLAIEEMKNFAKQNKLKLRIKEKRTF